ncbi:MAG TPA: hypothetical protein VNJ12_06865 [Candidatus Dormibacteraeota bacterium]|nr:hypothetical protein [Candidatus Dormibacteraeota bacterium]
MAARFIHVSFTSAAPAEAVNKVFNSALDWLKYSDRAWILYTTTDVNVWRDRIKNIPEIKDSDIAFFMSVFEPRAYSGYMTRFAWDWLKKDRSK